MTTIDLTRAQPQIRALARALGWERREVVQALEAHASIPEAAHKPMERRASPVVEPVQRRFAPAPKNPPRRSEPYRRWVARLPCAQCGIHGHSQCAHSDEGKGLGIKAGDDTCFPACADRPGVLGCHTLIGATGSMSREQRRALEQVHSESTRALAKDAGQWPKEWD